MLIFLLAGHETTSTALTFTMHLLGRHPDVQAAVHREITEVLGGRVPRADDIAKLAFTTMVLKEAMRLYPPAYALGRLAETEVTIAGNRIPAGSIVLLSPWATHRRPDFWPDAGAIRPAPLRTRREAARPRYAYFPFAGGLRGCIGGHFAMTEATVAIATLLARYAVTSESRRHRAEHRHHPAPRGSGALPGEPSTGGSGVLIGTSRPWQHCEPQARDDQGKGCASREVMAATVSSRCHGRAPRSASD